MTERPMARIKMSFEYMRIFFLVHNRNESRGNWIATNLEIPKVYYQENFLPLNSQQKGEKSYECIEEKG